MLASSVGTVVGLGVSSSVVRDMIAEGRRERFGALQSPPPLEWMTDNGSAYTAKATPDFATAITCRDGR